MPLNNFAASIIGRSAKCASRNVIKKAAYNGREKLVDERTGESFSYGHKDGLEWKGLFVPEDAPDWMHDRQQLYNAMERAEDASSRPDTAQIAHSWILALPHELTGQQRSQLMTEFAQELSGQGRIVDVSIHTPDEGGDERNYHAHVIVSMRVMTPEGFGAKIRAPGSRRDDQENNFRKWSKEELAKWKDHYSDCGARALNDAGFQLEAERFRVGHLTLEKQREAAEKRGDNEWADSLDREPKRHMGPAASAMERDENGGTRTHKGDHNRRVDDHNDAREEERDRARANGRPAPSDLKGVGRDIWWAYNGSDTPDQFLKSLKDRGLHLARVNMPDSQRNDLDREFAINGQYVPEYRIGEYVVVTQDECAYRLNVRTTGDRPWEVKAALKDLDVLPMKGLEETRAQLEKENLEKYRNHGTRSTDDMPSHIRGEGQVVWGTYNASHTAAQFKQNIEHELYGFILARVTRDDAIASSAHNYHAKAFGKYSPILREDEYVAVSPRGSVYRLTEKTVGHDAISIKYAMKSLDKSDMPSLREAQQTIEQRRIDGIEHAPGKWRGIRNVGRSRRMPRGLIGRTAGKSIEFAAAAVETLLAPILTPAQKRDGRIADAEREDAARQAERQRRGSDRDR